MVYGTVEERYVGSVSVKDHGEVYGNVCELGAGMVYVTNGGKVDGNVTMGSC